MEFQFVAADKEGKHISAIVKAESIPALIGSLKNQGLIPLRVSQIKSEETKLDQVKATLRRQVKGKEVAVFTRQLATILGSGIILNEALKTIAEDMENLYFSNIIEKVVADINAGRNLSSALLQYPRVFPITYVAVVKSGEEVGNLANTLVSLAKYLEDYERTREKFISAMRYPVFLFFFMIFIVSVIVLFLIPKFANLFARAGSQLPLLTRIVVGISNFWLKHAFMGVAILSFIWVLSRYLLKFPRIRTSVDTFKLNLPVIGQLLRKAIIARFCRTFSILLSGGVGLVSALAVSNEVVKNVFLQQIFSEIRTNVIAGSPLSEAMKPYKVIPRVAVKMVMVGEKSGKLDEMLKRTADYYDKEVEAALDSFSTMIEPVFIIVIGAVVLIVALALYLPIFQISKAVH